MTAPKKIKGVPAQLLAGIAKSRSAAEATCQRKHRYADEFACRAGGMGQMAGGAPQLFIYSCAVCRGWHLTRSEKPAYFAADYLEKSGYKPKPPEGNA